MTSVKSKNDDRNRNKDKIKGKQLDSSKYVQWHLDENNTTLLESEFAKSIAAKSIGALKIHKSANYDSFKPLFLDDPRNNPPLANAHISNEFDAQVEGAKRAWNKKGNKFAIEARFQRKDDNGPSKPCEVPYTFEKPQKYFGRHRQSESKLQIHNVRANLLTFQYGLSRGLWCTHDLSTEISFETSRRSNS